MCQRMLVVDDNLIIRAVRFEVNGGFDVKNAKAADDRSKL